MIERIVAIGLYLLSVSSAWATSSPSQWPTPPCDVLDTARHEIVSYSINPEHPKLGEPIYVTVVSRLVGDAEGGFSYALRVDGQNFSRTIYQSGTGKSVSGTQFVVYPVPPGPLWIDIEARAQTRICRFGYDEITLVFAHVRDQLVQVDEGPPPCAAAELDASDLHIQERGGTVCREVSVDGQCCWRARVSDTGGYLTTPAVQCGSHSFCAEVLSCDGPGYINPFDLNVADKPIQGICEPPPVFSPTPTVTPTMTPVLPTPDCRAADTAEIEITSLTIEPEHPVLGDSVHVRATSRLIHGLTFGEFSHGIHAQGEALTVFGSKPGVGTNDTVEFVLYPSAPGSLGITVGTYVQTAMGCYDGSFDFTWAAAYRDLSVEVGENPRPCASVDVGDAFLYGGEGDVDVCADVHAADDCCWSAAISGFGASLTTPPVQCGSHPVCVYVSNCDCSACVNQFEVTVQDKVIYGECRNRTPVPTPTETPSPVGTPAATPPDCSSPFCDGSICGGCSANVTVSEILTTVAIALGELPLLECPGSDGDGDQIVTVADIVKTVGLVLFGCDGARQEPDS